MTGYSNYDIFMNYCEGYMDAYNDYDDFATANPYAPGSAEWLAQQRWNEDRDSGASAFLTDDEKSARWGNYLKEGKKHLKFLHQNEKAADNQQTLKAIKEALGNLADRGIHLATSNPLITAAIAAGCTTAGAITAFVVHKMKNKKKKGSNFSEYNDFFLRDDWEDYTISEGDPRKELRRNLARAIGNRTTKHPFDTRSQAIEAKLYHNGKRIANYLTPEEKKAIYDKSTKRSRSRYPTMNRREQRELD